MEISTLFQLFRLFFDSVFNFLGRGAGRPRELIFNSISNFGPEGPKNSSGGIEGSQQKTHFLEEPSELKTGTARTALARTGAEPTEPGPPCSCRKHYIFKSKNRKFLYLQLPTIIDPDLPFLAFLENGKENHQKSKDFLSLVNPQNPWERREKRSKKQGIPCQRKKQGIPKSKERKIRGRSLRGIISCNCVLVITPRNCDCN